MAFLCSARELVERSVPSRLSNLVDKFKGFVDPEICAERHENQVRCHMLLHVVGNLSSHAE